MPPIARSTPGRAWWRRLYDLALHAFPADFRERWGDDMRATYADRIAQERTRTGRTALRLVARELHGVVSAGIAERLHASSRRARTIYFQDVRLAFRLLRRSPGFSLLTVLVLAGGLGLSTFTFSFLHTAMIRPLPLSEGARIVRLDAKLQGRRRPIDAVDVLPLAASLRTVREVGAYGKRELVLGREAGDERRVIDATVADPSVFGVSRTPALFGRALLRADAADGAEPVIVLSYRTWEVAFGADRAIIDAHVSINGVNTRVVGVMPEGFGFPVASEAWVPLPTSAIAGTRADDRAYTLVGRLAPGVSHADAAVEATAVLRRSWTARDTAVHASAIEASVESFPAAQIGEERTLVFSVLNLLAGLILLLALVNITNLLLARANERVRETAVRLALGASAARLVMQGMWETVILCLAGGIVGTAGASWGLEAITRWTQAHLEGNLAFWWVWRMDHVTLLSAGAFVTIAIAVLGSVVSLRTTRTNIRDVMQDGSARSGSRREGRLSRMLVTTQVATVTVLMFFGVVSGIMARRVVSMDPGFDTTRLLQAGIALPSGRYATDSARGAVYAAALTHLSDHREIDGVLLRRTLAEQREDDGRFAVRGVPARADGHRAFVVAMLGDLATVGVQVLEGRAISASDDWQHAPVALISRSLAARHWRGRSPVGDQLQLSAVGDTTRWMTIVGVASDVPYGDPLSRDRSPDAIYVPLLQHGALDYATFIARYRTTAVGGRTAVLQSLGEVDPLLIPSSVQQYDEVLAKGGLIATSVSKLFAGCFAFALVLALVGTYGLMSRAIGLRTREIGLRRALGATDAGITRLLLAQGGRQLGVGALLATPVLVALGLGFRHFFPIAGWILLAAGTLVSASIVALVLAATWVPSRRILRVTPRDALWRE